MEVMRHPFYVFDLDEGASLMWFLWTEKLVAIMVDGYKNAIRGFGSPRPELSAAMRFGRLTRLFDTASRMRTGLHSGGLMEFVPQYNRPVWRSPPLCCPRASRPAG
jgi:hypothetical protein